jgi:nucleoside-diphosphate-sugar epimerase
MACAFCVWHGNENGDNMTDILITGGAGVVGRSLCREFLSRGKTVRILTLPGDPSVSSLPPEVEVFYGNVTEKESLAPAFIGVKTVCHLAAILLSSHRDDFAKINFGGTCNVLAAAKEASVEKFVYISSVSVIYPVLTDYGKSKFDGEVKVKESGIPFVILRPTLVVEETGGIEYMLFLKYLKKTPIVFLPGGGKCLKRPVKTKDLVQGIAEATLNPLSNQKTYTLGGSRILTLYQMAQISLARFRMKKQIVNVPLWFCSILATLKQVFVPGSVSAKQALAGFRYDAAPDIREAECDLNYKPDTPFGERE